MRTSQKVGLVFGATFALLLQAFPAPDGLSRDGWLVVSLAVLMISWWVTEAIPIPVTSLLPLVFVPVTGIASIGEAAVPYSSPIVLLLMGGFIIAKSVEKWNLHSRIALNIVVRAGNHPVSLVGGFMVASAGLSMWISNTATVIMLIPIAVSVSYALLGDKADRAPLTIALLLGTAYGASIGGLGTPVGTPTNLIVMGFLEREAGVSLSFAQWMMIGLPTVFVMLPAAWFVLTRWGLKITAEASSRATDVVEEALSALGAMKAPERRVLYTFGFIAACWIFRRPLNELEVLGVTPFSGVTDHVIALGGAVLMFLVPSGSKKDGETMLLDWDTAQNIPWGVVLLFGGGLSLAAVITSSGLSAWLGGQMGGLVTLPLIAIMFLLVTFVVFATEVTSNVATASALLPVIGAIAVAGGADPVLLAVPVALAASCAFMMPMATGPNAIVFASKQVSIPQMASIGIRLNILAVVLITALVTVLAPMLAGANG